MEKDKIFENYFKQNEKTDDLTGQDVEKDDTLGQAAVKTANKVVNSLPADSPMKNKQTALNILAAIKDEAERKMQDPDLLAAMLGDIADEISLELAENKIIKVKIL